MSERDPGDAHARTGLPETGVISALVFVCYTGAALGVTNAFPLSTFSMYSKAAPTSGARLVVKQRDGSYHEVDRYTDWWCEPELEFEMVETTMCPDGEIGQPAGYLAEEALDHIRAHVGAPDMGEPVALVIRTWRLTDGIHALDCPVASCRVNRR